MCKKCCNNWLLLPREVYDYEDPQRFVLDRFRFFLSFFLSLSFFFFLIFSCKQVVFGVLQKDFHLGFLQKGSGGRARGCSCFGLGS